MAEWEELKKSALFAEEDIVSSASLGGGTEGSR
jgi:hypothetical protein